MFAAVKQSLNHALSKLGLAVEENELHLALTPQLEHGDITTPLPLKLASRVNKKPLEFAQELAGALPHNFSFTASVSTPGYLNFTFSHEALAHEVQRILKEGDTYPVFPRQEKTAIVEYSSPNIAKPFTVGHLRSTIIGDAIANLLEKTGFTVLRDNHVGDWGTQFGKLIYALTTWSSVEELQSSEKPIKLLVELYQKFHAEAEKDPSLEDKARAIFKKLEGGDSEIHALWQLCVEISWKEFSSIYQKLGVSFSQEFNNGRGLGESFFEDKMPAVIHELKTKGLLQSGEEGAQLVFFPGTPLPPLMIVKKDGTTLYATRDLATDKYRKDTYNPHLIINEVGAEQSLYFEQLYKVEELLGWYQPSQRVHVKHGLFRFKDGKMSTRKGNVIWLEDVINEAITRAQERGEEHAQTVAVGAIKWNDLKKSAHLDVVFDWDEILSLEGNSGPYMQYAYVRTQNILKKASKRVTTEITFQDLNREEHLLLRQLVRFPLILEESAQKYAPHLLCTYLFTLAQTFSTFYEKHRVIGAEKESTRLALVAATGTVIKNGLALLGIKTVTSM